MKTILLAISIIMVSAFFLAQARADNEIDIPMKFVWDGSNVPPQSGGSAGREMYGQGWWGFWNDYYPPSNGRRIILMEYTDADYAIKAGYERLSYIPSRHGDWTLFGQELWSNYEEVSRLEISAKGDEWDIIYFSPTVPITITSRTGYSHWFCGSTAKVWAGRTNIISMTACVTSS